MFTHVDDELSFSRGGPEETIPIPIDRVLTIGSRLDADLIASGGGEVAPTHAVISAGPHGAMLLVFERSSPVSINAQPVRRVRRLANGDRVTVGDLQIVYRCRPETAAPFVAGSTPPPTRAAVGPELERALAAIERLGTIASGATSEGALLEAAAAGIGAAMGASLLGVFERVGDDVRPLVLQSDPERPATFARDPLLTTLEERRALLNVTESGSHGVCVPMPGPVPLALAVQRPPLAAPFTSADLRVVSSIARLLGEALERVRLAKPQRAAQLELARLRRRSDAALGAIREGIVLVTDVAVEPLNERGEQLVAMFGDTETARRSFLNRLTGRARSEGPQHEDLVVAARIVRASATWSASLYGCVVVLRDVTDERARDRAHLEADRRQHDAILAATEGEQRRIGRDLHDSVCQQLAGVSFMLHRLKDRLTAQRSPDASAAAEVLTHVGTAIQEAQALARGLSPVSMEGGLESALRELVGRMSRAFAPARCTLDVVGELGALDDEVDTQLFQIAGEAVSNALRHGAPTLVEVRLTCSARSRMLEVEDDGRGFAAGGRPGGMGLHNMRQRARTLGATLRIEPNEPRGVRVVCSWAAREGLP